MPIYLCQPGTSFKEPWRHGVQVYERPFPLEAKSAVGNGDGNARATPPTGGATAAVATTEAAERSAVARGGQENDGRTAAGAATSEATTRTKRGTIEQRKMPIRGVVPLRGESNSPAPHDDDHERRTYQEDGAGDRDAAVDHDGNDEEDPPEAAATAARLRQRRFLQRHAAHSSVSQSSESFLAGGGSPQRQRSANPDDRPINTVAAPPAKSSEKPVKLAPVRRVRHAEVVLVDQCLIAYGRYWLRLRWPGEMGGFGGYVALGKVKNDGDDENVGFGELGETDGAENGGGVREEERKENAGGEDDTIDRTEEKGGSLAAGGQEREMVCQVISKTSHSKPPSFNPRGNNAATQTPLLCQETNVYYPTSLAMKLLPLYDDGLEGTIHQDDGHCDGGGSRIGGVGSVLGSSGSGGGGKKGMEEALLGSIENGEVSTFVSFELEYYFGFGRECVLVFIMGVLFHVFIFVS